MEEVVSRCCPAAWCRARPSTSSTHRSLRCRGPMGDSGLTGRKIIVDTYGGMGRHVAALSRARIPPRSIAPPATSRATSQNVVAAVWPSLRGAASLRHWRGEPVSLLVQSFAPRPADDRLSELVQANFDARPGASSASWICASIFRKTAAYGHFGRTDSEFTWERTDRAEALREALRATPQASRLVRPSVRERTALRAPTALARTPSKRRRFHGLHHCSAAAAL